jgi:hypothetical protein
MVPCPNFPSQCQALQDQYNQIYGLIQTLQKEVNGPGGYNHGIIQEIAALGRQLQEVQAQLTACLVQYGVPQPLSATLVGTATLVIVGVPSGSALISVGLYFSAKRDTVQITNFPTIPTGPYKIPQYPFGQLSTALSVIPEGSSGAFDQANGDMTYEVLLDATTTVFDGLFKGNTVDDSSAPLYMTTGSTKSPSDALSANGTSLLSRSYQVATL